jgi:uracil-DNA glycosylase
MNASRPETVQALLAWYAAMGADEAIGEAPVDRFAAAAPKVQALSTRPPLEPTSRPRRTGPVPSCVVAAETLADLEALVAAFDGCGLKRTAKNLCFKRGSDEARIMLIGEAPGRDEDLQGKPFVGRAGKLLDLMLAAIGLGEAQVYITNTVYWRPPGNRTPTPEEVEACAPFLRRQVELLNPAVLVLLGGAAVRNVLGVTEGIKRLRGKWLSYSCAGRDIPTLATLHPAYLLRSPDEKRYAWRDLLMLKETVERT